MSNSKINSHDEDLLSEIMTTLSAALVLNPKFNFGKLMDLSMDINSEKNKTTLTDIISLAFLNYLEMNEAAATLSTENIAAEAGFKALNLDDKTALLWFVRFIAVTNPVMIATMSRTLMNVVNGLMLQNTRTTDYERLDKVKNKLNKFVESGELEKRSDRLLEDRPVQERISRKEHSKLGLIGWFAGNNAPIRKKSASSSEPSSNASKKKNENKSTVTKRRNTDTSTSSKENSHISLREQLEKLDVNDDDINPDDSISNNSFELSKKDGKKRVESLKPALSSKKRVEIRSEDSVISG